MIDKYPEPPNRIFIHSDNAITRRRCFDSDVEYFRADAVREEIERVVEKYKEECFRTGHVWDELFSSIDTIGEESEPVQRTPMEEEKWAPTESALHALYDASIGAKLTKEDRNDLFAIYLYLTDKDNNK